METEVATDIDLTADETKTPEATKPDQTAAELAALKGQMAQLAKSNAEKDQFIQQMQERTLAAMERGNQPPPPQEDFSELDPITRKYVDAQTGQLQKQLREAQNQLSGSIAAHNALAVLDQYGIRDPKTRSVASTLASKLKANGSPMSEHDAVVFTLGQMALQGGGKLDLIQQDAPPTRRAGPDVITGGTRPMQMQVAAKPLPDDFDDLSPDQQIALLEKRGVDKLPL